MSSQPEEKKETRMGRGRRTDGDAAAAKDTPKDDPRPKTEGRGRGARTDADKTPAA